ncbi:hypothetical protein [Candidatus Palauibacter sp.]|uniref:hypothetical protein n=1 Tax=Candidatus Palauibacter sp. TaxID=3101350 RepID=UPI003B016B85
MIAHRYRFVRDPYERFVSLYLLARLRATSPGVSSSTTSSRKRSSIVSRNWRTSRI